MKALGWGFRIPALYTWGIRLARRLQKRYAGDGWIRRLPGYASGWTLGRDFPALPKESFREWWDRKGREETP